MSCVRVRGHGPQRNLESAAVLSCLSRKSFVYGITFNYKWGGLAVAPTAEQRQLGLRELGLSARDVTPHSGTARVLPYFSSEARRADGRGESRLMLRVCNRRKGSDIASIDPETGQLTPLFHPRVDRWDDQYMEKSSA